MEVADEIVVINEGRVEQVGSPDQLYDEPASDFVMGFLGEVTRLGPVRLRPHDVEVAVTPGRAGAFPGTVTRLLRVGFEVRLQVELDSEFAGGDPVSVVLSRSHARSLDLELGSKVWLTAAVGAVTVPAMVAV